MLTQDLNELLTRTGAGTPMGEVFRRFWMPALLSEEVAEPDGAPVRLKILGEELIAFRDSNGRIGIVEAYCSHRLAPLFFGRNEECGLRCPYHGWKFNVDGKCVDMPNVQNGNKAQVRARGDIKAYSVVEAGGIVWVYMGPKDKQPSLPGFEWLDLPEDQRHVSRWLQKTNYSVGMEGEIDTAHISWLHKDFDASKSMLVGTGAELAEDGAPSITLEDTEYGFTYGAARKMPKNMTFWRMTHWFAPMFSLVPLTPGPYVGAGGRAWVPIDDNNTTTFAYWFRVDRPLDQEQAIFASGAAFPPRMEKGRHALANGYVIDSFLPTANKQNDYLLDRKMQRDVNFSGIWGANEQDRALQESLASLGADDPGIVDRTRENLMASDVAIVRARNILISMAQNIQKGIELEHPQQTASWAVRAISKICPENKFSDFLQSFAEEVKSPKRT